MAFRGLEAAAGSQRSGLRHLNGAAAATLGAKRAARSPFVWLLAAILFINYVDRGLLPAAASLIGTELALKPARLGVLLSAFFWTYALVQIPVGWIAERYGAGRTLVLGLIVWSAATMLSGVATSFAALLGLRLLLGLGESTGFPCVSKLLASRVPVEGLGTANGIVGFSYLFGPAFGTYLGGIVMAQAGWRAAFLGFGALSLLWLWPWSRVAGTSQRPAPAERPGDGPPFAALLREPALWGASLGHFAANYTYYFMLSWLPYYLVRDRGFSTLAMAKVAGSAYLVTAVCALAAGLLIDRHVRRGGSANFAYKSIMVAAHLGAVVSMLGMALDPTALAIPCIFLYMTLCGASSPGIYAIAQILAGPQATGRWVGIQNAVGNLAGIVAPALTGLIIGRTGHFTAALLLCAAVSLIGLYGWVGMLPPLVPLRWPPARGA